MMALQIVVVAYVGLVRPFEGKIRQVIYFCEEFSLLLFLFFGGLFISDDWSYDNRKQLSQLGFLLFIWSALLPIFGFFLSLRSVQVIAMLDRTFTQRYENQRTGIQPPEPAHIASESSFESREEEPTPVRIKRRSFNKGKIAPYSVVEEEQADEVQETQFDVVEEMQNEAVEDMLNEVVQQKLTFPKPHAKEDSPRSIN